MKVLIVVATYNEVENIPTLVERLNQIVPDADILIVDDDSPDGTGQWCKEASMVNDHLDVIIRKDERGLGSATIRGMQEAIDRGYDAWLGMDADFSHPPEKLRRRMDCVKHNPCVSLIFPMDVKNHLFSKKGATPLGLNRG